MSPHPLYKVSPARHQHLRWRRPERYLFCCEQPVATLTAQELPLAATAVPIAFMRAHDNGPFVPVAVLGLKPGENLFVTASGFWIARYLPGVLSCYPFVQTQEDGRAVLSVVEDPELVSERPEGAAFFSEDGQPSSELTEILQALGKLQAQQPATLAVCEQLDRLGCLKPWTVRIETEQGVRQLQGLYQADDQALQALSDEDFLKLRRSGALVVAYCQMLSMRLMPRLAELARRRALGQAEAAETGGHAHNLPTANGELDLTFLSNDGTLRFDH